MAKERVASSSGALFLVGDLIADRRDGGISMQCFPISE